MKKKLAILFLFVAFAMGVQTAKAMSYDEAMKQSKPIALLIYADWAEGFDKVNQSFDSAQKQYGTTYNFVKMNIASSEAKNFNKKYYFYPNLPYALLIRDGGKVSRYLQKDNINDVTVDNGRLKFNVVDLDKVDLNGIKAIATSGVFVTGNIIKTLFKLDSQVIKQALEKNL